MRTLMFSVGVTGNDPADVVRATASQVALGDISSCTGVESPSDNREILKHEIAEDLGAKYFDIADQIKRAFAHVEPVVMGLGPIHVVPLAFERGGLSVDNFGVIESNETFTAQALTVAQVHVLPEKANPNGSAIVKGHQIAGALGNLGHCYCIKWICAELDVRGRQNLLWPFTLTAAPCLAGGCHGAAYS